MMLRTSQATNTADLMISVHIPKTGGTTFTKLLERVYGSALLLDYPWTAVARPSGTAPEILQALRSVRCIHGHFKLFKYQHLRSLHGLSVTYATWLRDPVERALSTYYYLHRKPSPPIVTPWERAAKELDVWGFMQAGFASDEQVVQLGADGLEPFTFVGITEQYEQALQLFKTMFFPDLDLSLEVEPQRVNPGRQQQQYQVDSELRATIQKLNDKDMIVYRQAVERFNRLCDQFLD